MDNQIIKLFREFQAKNEAIYDWSDEQFETLFGMMNIAPFKEYETLINIGEEASWFGFLLNGEVTVLDEDDIEIATLRPGSIIGEMSLFETGSRSATLIGKDGTDEGVIGVMRFDQLDELWRYYPEVSFKLLNAIATDAIAKLRSSLDVELNST